MKFSELVDISELHELCASFTSITGAVTAILDLEGNILTSSGWQEICTRFHRVHPATACRCRESDTVLAGRLAKGERYNVYKCQNGLIDVVVPITIGGEHVANFFTGQFFFEPPDKEDFIRQAEEFGFDKESYVAALSKVPVFSEDKIRSMMEFFTRLAQLMGEMGLARKNQEEANAELRAHQEHLEEQVMERTAELSKANRELKAEIAERKRAEEDLTKSEKKFLTVFHAVPALLAITTVAEGRIIDVNETWMRILGYQREEMIGRTSLELALWKSEADRDTVLRLMEEQKRSRDIEVNLRGKTGESLVGLMAGEFIYIDGERYVLAMINDITERKRAEMELETANRELEAFTYSVSHDLRKPLTVINGYCQAIRELCGDKLDEQCREYLQEAYNGTLRMNRLIDTLLNFSRLTHIEPRRETVDLSGVAQAVARELQLAEPARRVAFRITEGITAECDAALLRVVLDNLLGNAWKYTGTRDEGIIEFGATEVEGKPAYFVRDNGIGFDMADADKLFTPFQRLPGAEESKGFGIGLATVERIIRRHGGRIWAEGEVGKGAAFYFTLSD